MSQISGGSSEPKISAVPLRRRRRRGEASLTSILSSHSLSNLNCLTVDDDAGPAAIGAPMAPPLNAITSAFFFCFYILLLCLNFLFLFIFGWEGKARKRVEVLWGFIFEVFRGFFFG